MKLTIEIVPALSEVSAAEWDALAGEHDPFSEHAFLCALETSGSVGEGTGWHPCHVLVRDERERLSGALALYEKTHSYGEFIFDFDWAHAAMRSGLPYYPKLTAMAPFTPATGTRLLVHPEADRAAIVPAILHGALAAQRALKASSTHLLFLNEAEAQEVPEDVFLRRLTHQFHWKNRAPNPYTSFDDYLGEMRSEARKQTRKERTKAKSHGLDLRVVEGAELGDEEWAALARFYESTCDRKGSETYLTPLFFEQLRESAASERVVAALAYDGPRVVAGTLNFEKGKHLYGRYWGADREFDSLHFELCYYALIERAIAKGLERVEAGAQGIHKLKRGFRPSPVHSAHAIAHAGLRDAIGRHLVYEAPRVREEIAELDESSPFRRTAK